MSMSSCRLNDNQIRGQYGPGANPSPDLSDPAVDEPPVPEAFSIQDLSVSNYYKKGTAMTPVMPDLVGTAESFTIDPSLPTGMSLNSTTGEISGAPTTEWAEVTYKLSAHHADGRQADFDFSFYVPYEFNADSGLGALADVNPGDELCADSGGDCTLRAALTEANALSIPSIIHLSAATYSFPSTSELTASNGNITIMGVDKLTTILDGQNQSRILSLADNGKLGLENISLINGRSSGPGEKGGAIRAGLNSQLVLKDCRMLNNSAPFEDGNAVYSEGSIYVEACEFTGNIPTTSGSDGGAIAVFDVSGSLSTNLVNIKSSQFNNNQSRYDGGAIYSEIDVTIEESKFNGNSTVLYDGGALYSEGRVIIRHSEFINNVSPYRGGAINIHGLWDQFHTIENSYFGGNRATSRGGAIFFDSAASGFIIRNSTFVNNSTTHPTAGDGGTLYVRGDGYPGDDQNIENCTISGSSASQNGQAIATVFGSVALSHTIINDVPGAANCWWDVANSGIILSKGYNIDSGNSCGLPGWSQPGDLESTDPLLDVAGPQLNGDTVFSVLLAPSSPARDAVPALSCINDQDQRSVARPQGGLCDIGATEQ